jgi:hypothetical protein
MLKHALVLCLVLVAAAALTAADSGVLVQAVSDPNRPQIVVNPNTDRIIAQVVDGDSWKTGFFLTNLDQKTIFWALDFFTDSGGANLLPVVGAMAPVVRLFASMPPNVSVFIETPGTGNTLNQGWALLRTYDKSADQPDAMVVNDRIGGMAIFRQRIAGRPDFEAVVPITPFNETRFVLPFDNRGNYSTGIALLNPDPNNPISVQLAVHAEDGRLIRQDFFILPQGNKLVFSMPVRYADTNNQHGRINVSTNGAALSALGLRFNPGGAFTSTHALSVAP